MPKKDRSRKHAVKEEPYSSRNCWVKHPTLQNGFYWTGRRNANYNLLPTGGTAVKAPEFQIDRNAGMIVKPRGGGSGVERAGEKQTVVFYPPLSPRSTDAMTERFKAIDNRDVTFSPLIGSSIEADGSLSVKTASGAAYQRGGVYGNMHIFHKDLPKADEFHFDEYGSNMAVPIGVGNFNTPFPPLPPSGEILLTRARTRKWGGGARKDASTSQQAAMGNLSANTAAVMAGLNATGSYHWVHLFAYTMGGIVDIDPNVPDNLVVGTMASNMMHEKLEAKIKSLVDKRNEDVTIRYEVNVSDPLHKRFDLAWHVATEIKWSIIFGNNVEFEHTLDLLNHNPPRKGEKQFVNELIDYQSRKTAVGTT
jgi:hypothetical protein